jgi:hypothetical protein
LQSLDSCHAVAARIVIRLDHGDTGQFSLGTCHRRQGDALHAGHVFEHLLKLVHAGKKALTVTYRRQRMAARKFGQ